MTTGPFTPKSEQGTGSKAEIRAQPGGHAAVRKVRLPAILGDLLPREAMRMGLLSFSLSWSLVRQHDIGIRGIEQ